MAANEVLQSPSLSFGEEDLTRLRDPDDEGFDDPQHKRKHNLSSLHSSGSLASDSDEVMYLASSSSCSPRSKEQLAADGGGGKGKQEDTPHKRRREHSPFFPLSSASKDFKPSPSLSRLEGTPDSLSSLENDHSVRGIKGSDEGRNSLLKSPRTPLSTAASDASFYGALATPGPSTLSSSSSSSPYVSSCTALSNAPLSIRKPEGGNVQGFSSQWRQLSSLGSSSLPLSTRNRAASASDVSHSLDMVTEDFAALSSPRCSLEPSKDFGGRASYSSFSSSVSTPRRERSSSSGSNSSFALPTPSSLPPSGASSSTSLPSFFSSSPAKDRPTSRMTMGARKQRQMSLTIDVRDTSMATEGDPGGMIGEGDGCYARPELESSRRNQEKYKKICSPILDHIFVGGSAAAQNKAELLGLGITHVINCAGKVAPDFFPESFNYCTFRMNDHDSQDITGLFYNAIEFIEEARKNGGKVFIHCLKGISRSPAIAIAYLVWERKWSYEEAYKFVKQARPVVNPNPGFVFQLCEWEQSKPHVSRLPAVFRVDRHPPPPAQPAGTAKGGGEGKDDARTGKERSASLDNSSSPLRTAWYPTLSCPLHVTEEELLRPSQALSTHCLIIADKERMFAWYGKGCPKEFREVAAVACRQLGTYEGFPSTVVHTSQGEEPEELWDVLRRLPPKVPALSCALPLTSGRSELPLATPRGGGRGKPNLFAE